MSELTRKFKLVGLSMIAIASAACLPASIPIAAPESPSHLTLTCASGGKPNLFTEGIGDAVSFTTDDQSGLTLVWAEAPKETIIINGSEVNATDKGLSFKQGRSGILQIGEDPLKVKSVRNIRGGIVFVNNGSTYTVTHPTGTKTIQVDASCLNGKNKDEFKP